MEKFYFVQGKQIWNPNNSLYILHFFYKRLEMGNWLFKSNYIIIYSNSKTTTLIVNKLSNAFKNGELKYSEFLQNSTPSPTLYEWTKEKVQLKAEKLYFL